MSVKMRQEVERKIAEAVIDEALKQGYRLNVENGGDKFELPEPTTDRDKILEVMFATDDEHLFFYKEGKKSVGWVWFIYGNSGWDVISDHSTNLASIMGPADKISDHYSS